MQHALGELSLQRIPQQPKQPLRAWDAADELVLAHLVDEPVDDRARVLIVNDAFGALTCSLRHVNPDTVNESAAGREATLTNLAANGLPTVELYSSTELGAGPVAGPYDVVIIKIPKATAHLVDLLHRLRPLVTHNTRVIGASMVKHLRGSSIDMFGTIVGPTRTSLAKKKARLVHASVDESLEVGENPWPAQWSAFGSKLINHGGGFSPSSIDIGTSALLDGVADFATVLASDAPHEVRAVDLGCGNGVVGLRMARDLTASGRSTTVEAIDDSLLAIDATRSSWSANVVSAQLATHHHHRMIEVLDPGSVDLVAVNPPFHNDRVIGDHTAWSMFTDAHRVLRPGAPLVVVGNRHLGYHAKLNKIFGAVETVHSNAKFVVHLTRR